MSSKQQRSIHTPALILRRRIFGEADWMVTLFTPAHGKLDAIAYGARKPTSRKTGHVELFTLADTLLNLRREPGVLTSAELVEPFLPLREDLTRGAYAAYAVELLDRFTQTGDDDPPALFALLRDTLARLCDAPEPRVPLRYYELHLLDQVGFRPELGVCVQCGELIQPQPQFFSFDDGGAVCPDCAANNLNLASVTLTGLKLLRHFQRSPYADVAALTLTDMQHTEFEALLLGYITYILEANLQSAEFIRRLRRKS